MALNRLPYVLKDSFTNAMHDNAAVYSAALSYFMVFSLVPLLLLIIFVAGFFLGFTAVQKSVMVQLQPILGKNGTALVSNLIKLQLTPRHNFLIQFSSITFLILGALGIVGQLKMALNHIWQVTAKTDSGIISFVWDRIVNVVMVLVLGFLLLVFMILNWIIDTSFHQIIRYIPINSIFLLLLNQIAALLVITLLLAAIFKVLPDIILPWKYVWFGAFITAILFTIGKSIISIYIVKSGISHGYGAAASIIILLLWVFYSSQIIFIGAEFTKITAYLKGYLLIPSKYAQKIPVVNEGKLIDKNNIQQVIEIGVGFVFSALMMKLVKHKQKRIENHE